MATVRLHVVDGTEIVGENMKINCVIRSRGRNTSYDDHRLRKVGSSLSADDLVSALLPVVCLKLALVFWPCADIHIN